MNEEQRTEELDEKIDEDLDVSTVEGFEEDLTETVEESETEEDVKFEYDDEGNIVIPDDSEEETEEADNESAKSTPKGNDEAEKATEEAPEPEQDETKSTVPDARDVELKALRKRLKDMESQVKDTLKSLGADENGGIAELEKLADTIGFELPENAEFSTLGGMIMNELSEIPDDGTVSIEVMTCGLHIKVERVEDRRIESAIVTKLSAQEEDKIR